MFGSMPSAEPSANESVKAVTAATFKADVIDASKQALVLVDFGTPRDSLCAQMSAMLEKIARASKGAVKIARIDVERDAAVAQQLGVRSAPSVFAFYQGRPVDGFSGAVPEAQVKAWVDQLVRTTGAKGAEEVGFETAYRQAEESLAAGDVSRAAAIYADILEMEPSNATAYAGAVRCLLHEGELARARAMLDAAPADVAKDKAMDSVRAAAELAEQAEAGRGQSAALEEAVEKNPDDHQARFDLALALYAEGQREKAVDHLLDLVKRARSWNDDAARKQLVKFFEAMGLSDPLTISSRKRLSSVLFS
ncbi:MAG: tetratricopeptide repeat protein [Alphaproteobacteria bacterium]|nr:tetratricopeptide repeat protein [Alphaproteobacteria bacterium]